MQRARHGVAEMSSNVVMPEELSVGFVSQPTFSTDKIIMVNGQESRLPNRSIVIHKYRFDQTNVPAIIVAALRNFWYSRLGDFREFLMKDWADFELHNEIIGIANGVTTAFQVTKIYGTDDPYIRILRHLVPGYIIEVNGVVVPAENYTETSGNVVFDTAPTTGAIIINGWFLVPVRFAGDIFPVQVPFAERHVLSVNGLEATELVP